MGLFDKLFHKKEHDFDFDQMTQKEMEGNLSEQPDLLATPPPGFDEEKTLFETSPGPSPARFPGTALSRPSATQSATLPFESPANNFNREFNRDLELINSKLDTIKALLTSLEQRMGNLERAAGISQPARQQRLW